MIITNSSLERIRYRPTDHLYMGHEPYMRECRVVDIGAPRQSGKTTTIFRLAGPYDLVIMSNGLQLKMAKNMFLPSDKIRVISKSQMLESLTNVFAVPVQYTNRIFIDEVPFSVLEDVLMTYTKKVLEQYHHCPLIVRLGTNV